MDRFLGLCFSFQDIIELRERKWISRNLVAAPSTIAQIHEVVCLLLFLIWLVD